MSMIPLAEFFVSDEYPMYVQQWGTVTSSRRAILVHGGVHTGVCWTTRPNGQPGWAQYLAEQGWMAYVIDWPGVGRSTGTSTLLQSTADHIVSALAALLRETGPALLIGHSVGGAIAAKVMEVASKSVTGLISIAPAPHGNLSSNREPMPADRVIVFDDEMTRSFSVTPRAFQRTRSINTGDRFAR